MSRTLLIIKQENKVLSLLYEDNRLLRAAAHPLQGTGLEAVYIGKVKNIVPSLDAAFVEYQPDTIGFLPLKTTANPLWIRRSHKDRLVAGDELLIQVEKAGIKTKAPGLTGNLSFTGRYCVITTGKQQLGYSSKLKLKDKQLLRDFLQENGVPALLQENAVGMVVRTNAAALHDKQILLEEIKTLLKQKETLAAQAAYRTCYSCLYAPPAPYLTDIRDTYADAFDKILTDDEAIYEQIKTAFYPREATEDHVPFPVELYQDQKISLDRLYAVGTRLQEALSPKVWLKSGAYLVIQPTEALTVIDVNSGKLGKKNASSDIFYRINREAAKEIALQLKLRNLSGIILIDFINQSSHEEDEELLHYLSSLVKQDSVKTDVIDMTPLGLVEVTRKKINKSLAEQLTQTPRV